MLTDLAQNEKKKLLEQSLAAGIIDRARFEEVLAESLNTGPRAGLVVSGTRVKGAMVVADHSGMWITVATGYESAKCAMADTKNVTHCDNQGKWAWNTIGTKIYKRCNFHKECPVMLRAVQNPDKTWRQEVLNVSHAIEHKDRRGTRTPFTFEQEAKIIAGVNAGDKPSSIRNDMTMKAIEAGCTEKRAGGGLTGGANDGYTRYIHRYVSFATDTCTIRMCTIHMLIQLRSVYDTFTIRVTIHVSTPRRIHANRYTYPRKRGNDTRMIQLRYNYVTNTLIHKTILSRYIHDTIRYSYRYERLFDLGYIIRYMHDTLFDTCTIHQLRYILRYSQDTSTIHYNMLRYNTIHCITTTVCCVAVIPKLPSFQNYTRKLKVARVAGVIVKYYSEMQEWASKHELPTTLDEVEPFVTYAVPFDAEKFNDVEAVVLTMHVQINWIGILVHLEFYYCCHIDGKHKLHHGDWMLITFGTHSIHQVGKQIRHTFRPLIYMFVKQQESSSSIFLGLTCCNLIATRFFQKPFAPKVGIADHGPGILSGFKRMWPDGVLLGCYPHITWHLTHGMLLPKQHPLFEEACTTVPIMHLCETPGMWNVLLDGLAREWGDDDADINKLWDSIFVEPRDNWYIGYNTDTPLTYPSQQTQENWHNIGVMSALRRELGASTETLLEKSLPKIMSLDAALKADELTFSIPRSWLPTPMYKKAAKALADPAKYVKVVDSTDPPDADGNIRRWYYVLSQSQTKYTSISATLISQYEDLRRGFKPSNTAGKFTRCVEIMQALHKVEELDPKDPRIVPVKANPCSLRCHICKAFAMLGICHHILVVTDLIMQTRPESERLVECDVQKALMLVDKNKKKDSLSRGHTSGAKALDKSTKRQVGKYSSKKSQAVAARAREKKAVKDRAATATQVIGVHKKKAAPRPARATAAARKKQIDSSDEEEKEEEEEDSSDED